MAQESPLQSETNIKENTNGADNTTEKINNVEAAAAEAAAAEPAPKRRGRPPKAKAEAVSQEKAVTKAVAGSQEKAEAGPQESGEQKKARARRGRPPKAAAEKTAAKKAAAKKAAPAAKVAKDDAEKAPVRRGRPPKNAAAQAAEGGKKTPARRGRPPKAKAEDAVDKAATAPARRGRPPKAAAALANGDTGKAPARRGRPPKSKAAEAPKAPKAAVANASALEAAADAMTNAFAGAAAAMSAAISKAAAPKAAAAKPKAAKAAVKRGRPPKSAEDKAKAAAAATAPAPLPTPRTDHKLTNQAGIPIPNNTDSVTAGPRGPILMQDVWLQEKLAHFDREVIPERRMHAKGSGAFGVFTVTNDITRYTCADVFSKVGKVTPVFVRFSTVAGERGAADAERDIRGFATKFYTGEGNWDLVGNNTPVFFIRDAHKFPDLNHAVKRDPKTNCRSAQNNWDFWSSLPEALHQVTITMSDRGLPVGYRNMHGFGSHTFSFINKAGELVWVKFHWVCQQPILNWTDAEAAEVIANNRESSQTDLFNAIERKDFPRWQLNVQIMTQEQAATHPENPFDITKVWSHKDYPLIEVGMLELNKNPENYFVDVEQAAFNPAHVVPGISYSPDKLLQGRLFAYGDAHRYRLGVNHDLIPVNKPAVPAHSYHRDGMMRVDANYGAEKGYTPNSIGAWVEQADYTAYIDPVTAMDGAADRWSPYASDDPYKQPGDLWRLLAEDKKAVLVENTARNFAACTQNIKLRHCAHCYLADAGYGKALAEAASLDLKEVKRLARLPLEKRLAETASR